MQHSTVVITGKLYLNHMVTSQISPHPEEWVPAAVFFTNMAKADWLKGGCLTEPGQSDFLV